MGSTKEVAWHADIRTAKAGSDSPTRAAQRPQFVSLLCVCVREREGESWLPSCARERAGERCKAVVLTVCVSLCICVSVYASALMAASASPSSCLHPAVPISTEGNGMGWCDRWVLDGGFCDGALMIGGFGFPFEAKCGRRERFQVPASSRCDG
eukprot:799561-Rhodomonas_salina.2